MNKEIEALKAELERERNQRIMFQEFYAAERAKTDGTKSDVRLTIPEGFRAENITVENGVIRYELVPIKKEYPKSWEELRKVSGYYANELLEISDLDEYSTKCEDNKNIYPTYGQTYAYVVLLPQLLQLVRAYNDDEYVCLDGSKHYIQGYIYNGKVKIGHACYDATPFVFNKEEQRDLFLETFEPLIIEFYEYAFNIKK